MHNPKTKTVAFRKTLRQSLDASDWRHHVWAKYILAAECVQGWAGRKRPNENTMLKVYCSHTIGSFAITEMASFLGTHGVPSFNLVPIRNYAREVSANRVSRKDTQDRFWLLGNYNCIDETHWDHWVLTKFHWGTLFKPTPEQALTILQDPTLFESMVHQDWSYANHHEQFYWPQLVMQLRQQWPEYSVGMSLLNTTGGTEEEFVQIQLQLREQILHPQPLQTFELP